MNHKILVKTLFVGIWFLPIYGVIANEDSVKENESSVSIAVKATKNSYKPGEVITLAVAVANFGNQPFYIPVREPQIFDPYFWIRDANGVIIGSGAIDDPNRPISPHYYMSHKGKSVILFPVLEVKKQGLIISIIPNALKQFRDKLKAGRYYLEADGFPVIFEAPEVISRPDYPKWLWVESTSNIVLIKHKPIEIIINDTAP